MPLPDATELPRRDVLRAAVAAGGTAALSACLEVGGPDGDSTESIDAPTGDDPDALPDRQHAWNDSLASDDDGNLLAPEHHVLLALDLATDVDDAARETVEASLRELERALAWEPDGLLFTIGYSPSYFERFDESHPDEVDLPQPEALTSLEDPDRLDLDTADALLHLASDDAAVVLAAEEALFGELEDLNGHDLEATVEGVFERSNRRTGFIGAGLPSEKQAEHPDMGNMPHEFEIHEDAPFWMGFRAGFAESQATEDRVSIESGPFAGGSTQHVETMRLQLRTWFEQESHEMRIKQMFSPAHVEEDLVGEVGENLGASSRAAEFADRTEEHAREAGFVGHAQKAARAREDGEPLLLRRDCNAVLDGEFPGVHFLSLQREVSEFARVREAMAGEDVGGSVGRRLNNGILQYVTVLRRGNFLVPPRPHRSLPLPRPES